MVILWANSQITTNMLRLELLRCGIFMDIADINNAMKWLKDHNWINTQAKVQINGSEFRPSSRPAGNQRKN
jgi:hypothetical protein